MYMYVNCIAQEQIPFLNSGNQKSKLMRMSLVCASAKMFHLQTLILSTRIIHVSKTLISKSL